jgi:hypothetical protein
MTESTESVAPVRVDDLVVFADFVVLDFLLVALVAVFVVFGVLAIVFVAVFFFAFAFVVVGPAMVGVLRVRVENPGRSAGAERVAAPTGSGRILRERPGIAREDCADPANASSARV